MREQICQNCGGKKYKSIGQNKVKCLFCGTIYVDTPSNVEEAILLVKANELLRDLKFEQAQSEFEKIVSLYPTSFEALFGKVLSKHKIVCYQSGDQKFFKAFGDDLEIFDEDFKRAIEIAPSEVKKEYLALKDDLEKFKDAKSDAEVFVCGLKSVAQNISQKLQESGLEAMDGTNLSDCDEFSAIESAKVLVICVDGKELDLKTKSVIDRWKYRTSKCQKLKDSMIFLTDGDNNKDFSNFVVLDMQDIAFLQELIVKSKNIIEKSKTELVKIETKSVEKIVPQKKEFVDFQTVAPQELGNFSVENIPLDESGKIKWMFLSLKNGDFKTCENLCEQELLKNPNNADARFAKLMCDKKIKTKDEFFKDVSCLDEKNEIDEILKFASRDFSEEFVDGFEQTLIDLDDEEKFDENVMFLAKYKTPKRDEFLTAVENKAVLTQNKSLIEKLECCFDPTDVERYINFYFSLAQNSGDYGYYQKILELDQGHEKSQIAMFLTKFKSPKERLAFDDRGAFEQVLGFLSDDAREKFLSFLIKQVVEVAYIDTQKAKTQIDFFLSYISNNDVLVETLKNVVESFQMAGFFTIAERYAVLAISKQPADAELYWTLLKIKAHCKTDNEVVLSPIKLSDFVEWQSLLSVANDEQSEKYASIVSKANVYSGAKQPFARDQLDLWQTREKLTNFINRNNQILIDAQKAGNFSGIAYFKSQLKPFEKYLADLDNINSFEQFLEFSKKLDLRLKNFDITLDGTINSNMLSEKSGKFKYKSTKPAGDGKLRTYVFWFIEFLPTVFFLVAMTLFLINAKIMLLNISEKFFYVAAGYCLVVATINVILLFTKFRKNVVRSLLTAGALLTVVMFLFGFWIFAPNISVSTAKEFDKLTINAQSQTLVLENDIDFEEISWSARDFGGTIIGNGHALKNVLFKGKNCAIFDDFSGGMNEVVVILKENSYQEIETFAAVANNLSGTIENCTIEGNVEIESENVDFGGIVAYNHGKLLKNKVDLTLSIKSDKVVFGGLASTFNKGVVEQNFANIEVDISGKNVTCGGLVGNAFQAIKNCYATGSLTATGEVGYVGGLFGETNCDISKTVEYCYSVVEISTPEGIKTGALTGKLGTKFSSCFALSGHDFFGQSGGTLYERFENVLFTNDLADKFYDQRLGFDEQIWQISNENYPTLK